jgi:HSP20 family molecular chaperone IbpA
VTQSERVPSKEMSKLPPPSGIMSGHSSLPPRESLSARVKSTMDTNPFASPDVMPRRPAKDPNSDVSISAEARRRNLNGATPEEREQARAYRAEQEAYRRIEKAEEGVDVARNQAREEIEKIQSDTELEIETERARSSSAVERIKTQGQTRIDELRRELSKEANRVRKEGEQHVDLLRSHYRDTISKAQDDGESSLREIQTRNHLRMDHEKKSADFQADSLRENQATQAQQLRDHHGKAVSDLKQQQQFEMDHARSETDRAKNLAEQRFQNTFSTLMGRQDQELQNLFERSQTMLTRIRDESASKLGAYETRQEDPFYKLQDLEAKIVEEDDQFVITARVPLHEQKNLSVSVRENQVTLSGHRRNQEQLQVEPGRSKSTSSYQVFSESFPLSLPVNAKGVVKLFEGEDVTIVIPKKRYENGGEIDGYHRRAKNASRTPARVRQERPQFPENLPISPKSEGDRPLPEFPSGGSKRSKLSGGTLG